MVHEVNTTTFSALSTESQEKVLRIFDIALLRRRIRSRPIGPKTFDRLYDSSLSDLDEHIHALSDVASNLQNIEGE